MKRNFVALLLLIALTFSCGPKREVESINCLEINDLEFCVDSLEIIELSNSEEAFIGDITSCHFYNGRIYILDTYKTYGVKIFFDSGEYIAGTKRGKGPGELIYPYSLSFSQDSLVIHEMYRFVYYDLNGTYLKDKALPAMFYASAMAPLTNGHILAYGSSNVQPNYANDDNWYRYRLYDSDMNTILKKFIITSRDFAPLECDHPISIYDNSILFVSRPENFIYSIVNGDIKVIYQVEFNEYSIDKDDLKGGKFLLTGSIQNGQRFGLLDNLYETGQFIAFSYLRWNGIEFVIYSKKKRLSTPVSQLFNLLGLPKMEIVGTEKERLICAINPEELSEMEISNLIERGLLSDTITRMSNYILVLINFC
ncbi:MAG: 6-bladed beta-propeller [Bacteroidales bacterium]|nr:6-bladed beta-propeller [Bacteroidales bacterium]